VLGDLGLLSTSKVSSRGEAFPHTYKVITNPFHNRYEITPTKRKNKKKKIGNKNVEGVKKRKTKEKLTSVCRLRTEIERKKERERVFRTWGAVLACLG
jgi:hypothetical protein